MRPWLLLLGLALSTGVAQAQAPAPAVGSCAKSRLRAVLDRNDVRAEIFPSGVYGYEVPRGTGLHAIQTADIWVGGRVGGELRVAGDRWWRPDFWPGPLLPGAVLPDPADCTPFDRMWEITVDDLEAYALHGVVSRNLAEWPWHLGAPVVDGDGDPTNYDLKAGDRPELVGQQRFWWVMNDVGNVHTETRSRPLGIEVHGSAASAENFRTEIDQATIHSFRVINRSGAPIEDAFLAVYSEADLGFRNPIYVGVDTSLGMSFAYNAQNSNTDYEVGIPPAIGLMLLDGPPAASDGLDNDYDGVTDEPGEKAGMGHFMGWGGDEDIIWAQEKYNMMTGTYRWGYPMTYGGEGWGGTVKTRYQWPGDPVTRSYWSAMNIDSAGTAMGSIRAGSVTSFGPFRLAPGASAEFTFAYVWAQGRDHLDSITELRRYAAVLKRAYRAFYWTQPSFAVIPEPGPGANGVTRPFPNPADEVADVRFTVARPARITFRLFDLMGRSVGPVVDATSEAGEHAVRIPVADLPTGLYVYRASIGSAWATGTLVVVH